MERGRKIPKSHLTQLPTQGNFNAKKSISEPESDENGALIFVEELVLAHPFSPLRFHVSMFAVFHHSHNGHGTAYPRHLLMCHT